MTFWAHIWNRLKAVPVGVWAALAVAMSILGLYLRGRRLEAELGRAKLSAQASEAKSKAARASGRADLHLDIADEHNARANDLEAKAKLIRTLGDKEQARLAALPPDKITDEYLKLAEKKRVETD
jgi:hypothetical protein